jgi:hypothetical protein
MDAIPSVLLRGRVERCPRCGLPMREERSHYRCEQCGIVEACCEGMKDLPEMATDDLETA